MRLRLALAGPALAVVLTACSTGPQPATEQSPATPPSGPVEGSSPVAGSVWVANDGGDSLNVIDAATNTVTVTLTGLKNPHNVQASPDGSTVYAVDTDDTLVAIDPTTYTVTAAVNTGAGPAHVIEAPNGKVYVTNDSDATVSVFQTPGLQSAGLIKLDSSGMPHGIRAAANGSVIVVADMHARHTGAVDLIDPSNDQRLASIAVGPEPVQVAVSADGRYAYASITGPPSVAKVDLPARKVVGTVAVSARPAQLYLTPDDATVLSADEGTRDQPGHALSVIDTASMTVRTSIPTGSGPHGVVVDDSGSRAWVTNLFDDTVSVIDLHSQSSIATVKVAGPDPTGVSYSKHPPAAADTPTIALTVPAPVARP